MVSCLIRAECSNANNHNPAESSRQYSSVHGSGYKASQLDSSRAWCAKQNQAGEWMQIDADEPLFVGGVITQGRLDKYDQWVTEYQVQTSNDGSSWDTIGTFSGNSDRNTKVKHMFAKPVAAKSVRFVVNKWKSHISMRAALVVCAGWFPRPLARCRSRSLLSVPTGLLLKI